MKRDKMVWKFAGLGAVAMALALAIPARAQTPEVKEKPPQYSYASFWTIPRAQWPDMEKVQEAEKPIFDEALANGTIIGYGSEKNLVHQPHGDTHAQWWSSLSMAGLLNMLARLQGSDASTSPVLQSATRHWDEVYVSRYYDRRAGSRKVLYTRAGFYKLKDNAPDNAVELLSKTVFAPAFEKLFADGTVVQWEINAEAVHTDAPGRFWIFCLTPNPEGIDKINAAMRDALQSNPVAQQMFDSLVDFTAYRDYVAMANASYK